MECFLAEFERMRKLFHNENSFAFAGQDSFDIFVSEDESDDDVVFVCSNLNHTGMNEHLVVVEDHKKIELVFKQKTLSITDGIRFAFLCVHAQTIDRNTQHRTIHKDVVFPIDRDVFLECIDYIWYDVDGDVAAGSSAQALRHIVEVCQQY